MTRKIYMLATIVSITIAVSFTACNNSDKIEHTSNDSTAVDEKYTGEPREGDMCSVISDSTGRSFGVVKVLKIEDNIYHIRTYGVSFDNRPTEQDIKDLKATPAGIGHLPLDKKQFLDWKPEVIVNQPVAPEELEGYNLWKQQK